MQGSSVKYNASVQTPTAGYSGVVGAAHVLRDGTATVPGNLRVSSMVAPFADLLVEHAQLDGVQFATPAQTYDLRGVVVLRGNHTAAGGAITIEPQQPKGVSILP